MTGIIFIGMMLFAALAIGVLCIFDLLQNIVARQKEIVALLKRDNPQ
jgi:hypothetical protein